MDERRRRLERKAATGDYDAWVAWRQEVVRSGERDPIELGDPTEWEDTQDEFDDFWWHRVTSRRCRLWGSSGRWRFSDVDFPSSIFKAHHTWGHSGWFDGKNSKRKTLRTHRNTKKRSRNHRLREERSGSHQDAPHERRRKKRFGGREHRYGRDWIQNQRTGRWRIVYKFSHPNLDE